MRIQNPLVSKLNSAVPNDNISRELGITRVELRDALNASALTAEEQAQVVDAYETAKRVRRSGVDMEGRSATTFLPTTRTVQDRLDLIGR